MRNYAAAILLLLFSVLMGTVLSGPLISHPFSALQQPEDPALEAEIAKLRNVTRLSRLPPDTIYNFEHKFINATSGVMETIVLHPTAAEMVAGFDTPDLPAHKKRAGEPEFGVVCETSSGSPEAFDTVKAMVTMNWKERDFCCQYLPFGSKCNTLESYKSAAVGICGPWMRCVPCPNAVDFLLILVDRCRRTFPDGRTLAGGKFNLGAYGVTPPYGGYLLTYHT